MKAFDWFYLLGLSFILFALCLDGSWTLKVEGHDVRLSYLGAAIIVLSSFFDSRFGWIELRNFFFKRWALCFAAMSIPALFATLFVSENPKRSVIFLVWSLGTLLGLPWVANVLVSSQIGTLLRLFSGLVVFQALVPLVDGVVCLAGFRNEIGKSISIGRVYLNDGVCRPHGWYQEPNYLAAFLVVAAAFFFRIAQLKLNEVGEKSVRLFYVAAWLASIGALATTSRLALLAVPILWLIEIGSRWRVQVILHRRHFMAAAAFTFSLAMVGSLYFLTEKGFALPRGSIGYRLADAQAAMHVFLKSPWVGVGPGSAGAYLVQKMPEHPYLRGDRIRKPEDLEYLRNDPLSTNLYTELLSEWGGLGAALFFIGLTYWIYIEKGVFHRSVRGLGFLMTLFCVYLSTQTLPRFDFWFVIGLYGAVIRTFQVSKPGLGSVAGGIPP